jgi:hypothetical protein
VKLAGRETSRHAASPTLGAPLSGGPANWLGLPVARLTYARAPNHVDGRDKPGP